MIEIKIGFNVRKSINIQFFCRYSWFTQKRQFGIPFENVYLGDWLLYKMADGNPRVFCNILGDIVLCLLSSKEN